MEKIELLYSVLKKDKEFFNSFKDSFVDFFTDLSKDVVKLLDSSSLRSIADRLYILLFSFNKNPLNELKNFISTVAKSEIDLKPVLSSSFLYLLKNFIDYLIEKNADFERIKVFVELLDIYLFVIDSAYLEYTKSLEKEIENIKKEKNLEEIETIFKTFEILAVKEQEINIIDFYQEVPVICKAKPKDIIGKKFVVFEYSGCKYKNFYIEGNDVYIKIDIFPKAVRAVIEEADVLKEKVKLKNFEFVELPQERRKYIRVKPKQQIPIEVIKDGEILKGIIADISIGGVGIYLKDIDNLKKGDKIKLRFELRDVGVENTGTIKYVQQRDSSYKIGVEFDYNEKVEEIISEYVVRRQFEIIKELRI